MSVDDVTEKLKAIGPYVTYEAPTEQVPMHRWSIGSAPQGVDAHRAMLCVDGLSRLDDEDWDSLIAEGKNRYEGRT